jgi:hypothetical protein
MNRPNIFNCATREMSQEAFIFWLLQWSDPEASIINAKLHKLSHNLIKALFNKHNQKLPSQIEKIDLLGGYCDIDMLLIINNTIIIPIQDKIYNRESPDQLLKYIQVLKDDGHPEENILPIYLQTGTQGNHKKLMEIGFIPFSLKELLNVLNSGQTIKNDILHDYIEYLKQLETDMQSFRLLSLDRWHLYSWQGFYNYLQSELKDGEWDAITNSSNSFLGFWWNWHSDRDCEQYLQLEKEDLCFKIRVHDKRKRTDLKLRWSDRFIKASAVTAIKVVTPLFQNDDAITVAVVDGNYRRADKNGIIDLKKTLDVIIETQKLFDKAVNLSPSLDNL